MTLARVLVPAGAGRAVRVSSGSLVVVENPIGGQVGDLFAFHAEDASEFLSAGHTRASNWSLFPAIGQPFVTNRRRPILTLLEDTSPGIHDMLVPACDEERYRHLGAPGHPSCGANLEVALATVGLAALAPITPQPVNLFMPVSIGLGGSLTLGVSPARAGDRVVLRAELPVVVVLSACPQDLIPLNAGGLSDLALEVRPDGGA
jgi:uncharacterized protein YcgI (DUF1989 family)